MLHLDSQRKTDTEGAINAPSAWLIPGSLSIANLLGVAFVAAISGALWSGAAAGTAPSQPAPQGIILGALTSHPLAASTTASTSPTGHYAFAFGYLEFDWDLNAPGGVPGFQGWPS